MTRDRVARERIRAERRLRKALRKEEALAIEVARGEREAALARAEHATASKDAKTDRSFDDLSKRADTSEGQDTGKATLTGDWRATLTLVAAIVAVAVAIAAVVLRK